MKPTKMTFFPSFTKMPDQIDKRKYMILLVSFLILIFGNTFTENVQLFGIVNIYQNLLAGLLVFFNKKRLRYMILCIIIISAVLDLFANDFFFYPYQKLAWDTLPDLFLPGCY